MSSDNQDNKSDSENKDDAMEAVEKQILQTLEHLDLTTTEKTSSVNSSNDEPLNHCEAEVSVEKSSSQENNDDDKGSGKKERYKNNLKKRPNQTSKQKTTSKHEDRTEANQINQKQPFQFKKKQNQGTKSNQPSTSAKKPSKESWVGRKVGIVHTLHPQIFLTNEQMNTIQQNILQAILDQPKSGTKPGFRGITRHKGWLGITCLDEPTVDWLRSHVMSWYQRTLKVVEEEAITKPRRKAHAFLPGCAIDPEAKIFQYLQKQNEGLRTDNWTVLSRVDENMSTRLVLLIDESSAEELEKHREVNIKFGKGTIRVKSRKGEDSTTEGLPEIETALPTCKEQNTSETPNEGPSSSSSPNLKGERKLKKQKRPKANIPNKVAKPEEGDGAQKGE